MSDNKFRLSSTLQTSCSKKELHIESVNNSSFTDYMSDLLYKRIGEKEAHRQIETNELGKVKIRMYIDGFFNCDYTTDLFVVFETEDNKTDDDVYDAYNSNDSYKNTIKEMLDSYIQEVNDIIKEIKVPSNHNTKFSYGIFYVDCGSSTSLEDTVVVDTVIVQYDSNIDLDELIDTL